MKSRKTWTSLAVLLAFTLFSLCMMLVLLTGASGYRRLENRGETGFAKQTAAQYISTRFHQGRDPGIEDFYGCDALVLAEEIDGQRYLTRVYCLDGSLMELFSTETAQLSPEDGEMLLPLEFLRVSQQDGVFTVEIPGQTLYLTQREGREIFHGE